MVSRITGIFKRREKDLDCEEVRDLSSDYIDEELDQATADKVSSHLDWCGPCNAFVNTLRATVRILRGMPKSEAPSDLRQRVRENLRDSPNENI